LGTSFFATGVLIDNGTNPADTDLSLEDKNYKLGIGFGVVNFIFSCTAFFFIETDHFEIFGRFRGRRFLLLFSLISGAVVLLITASVFNLPMENSHREGTIIALVLIYTMVYSPGE